MKLTKKLEKEISEAYIEYWDCYLRGDTRKFMKYIAPGMHLTGTTESEVIAGRAAIHKFILATKEQVVGKVQMRQRKLNITSFDKYFFIFDQVHLYLLIDNTWTFYSKFRISTIARKDGDGWKYIQQHASVPDTATEEGETISFQKISKENQELRDAVKRRTIELENKNRELEIESSLERVRAVAMGMRTQNDLLNICEVLFKELRALGFDELRNALIHTFVDEEQYFNDYDYSDLTGGNINRIPYSGHPVIEDFIRNIRKSNDAFSEDIVNSEELERWKEFRRNNGEAEDPSLENISILCYYNYSIGTAAIGISTFAPISENKREVLKRFRNVFEFAYKRYTDVALAEAQAEEAKLEASLEKVRAMALSMYKPDDLPGICEVLFVELRNLGFAELRNTMVNIFDDDKGSFLNYDYSENAGKTITNLFYNTHPVIEKQVNQARSSPDAFSEAVFAGNDLAEWKKFRKKAGEKADPRVDDIDALYYYFYSIETGVIGISTYTAVSKEKRAILKRFRNVFDFAYRRYIDVAQAEAQAREARIELALERVRARAMAMQNSNELSELVDTVFKELTKLDFALTWCIINIIDERTMSNTVWAANPDINKAPESYHMLFEDYPFHDAMMKGWKERKTKDVYVLEGLEKKIYDEYLFTKTEFSRVPAEAQAASRAMKKYVVTFSFSNFGGLQTVGDVPLSDANLDILSRFGKVFDLTYTRFNDLKLAEAQAREAQIEAALERVRSRSMGMQKSEELKEVIQVVYEQFVHLHIHVEHTGFIMDHKTRDDMYIWLADKHAVPFQVTIPYFDCAHWNSFNEAKEKGFDFFANQLSFEEKNKFYQDLFKLFPVPDDTKDYYLSCPGLAISTVLLENVGLYIENFSGIPYSHEENDILMRFGKVFQQTYTRFLDLQKAEAQAREARIEAALERTRTQSMIMQHSKELDDTLKVFHEQVLLLGIPSAFSYLWLPDEDSDRHIFWAAWGENENGSTIFKSKAINYPLDRNDPATAKCLSDWKSDVPVHSYHLPPPEVENYLASWKELLDGVERLKPEYFRDGLYYVEAYMKYGCFGVMVVNDLTEDEKKILLRFTIEFERTYTRFLDLQKAEAQAREAQIETALERIRARALAMHNSNEFLDMANVLRDQMRMLGQPELESCIVHLYHDSKDETFETWYAYSPPGDKTGKIISGFASIPKSSTEWARQVIAKYKSTETEYTILSSGEMLHEWYKTVEELAPDVIDYDNNGRMIVPEKLYYHLSKFSGGALLTISNEQPSVETRELQKKAAGVFDLAYTRFLDLQKAETQAREAQIENALEKVRSRTMAMQRSEELPEAANNLFLQVQSLGIPAWSAGYCVWDEDKKGATASMSSEGVIQKPFRIPVTGDPSFVNIYEAYKRGETFYVEELGGEALVAHYKFMRTLPVVGDVLDGIINAGFPLPTFQIFHVAYFTHGYLLFITYEKVPEAHSIFKRFTNVFEQTYTRFLDLQKAEAQAKEAKIEAALERVRSKTMAMHNSSDVEMTVAAMFDELVKLGVDKTTRCGIGILDDETHMVLWTASTDTAGKVMLNIGKLDMTTHPLLLGVYHAWKNNQTGFTYELTGQDMVNYYTVINNAPDYHFHVDIESLPERIFHNDFFFSEGALFAFTIEPIPEEMAQIFKRFAGVFGQTYRRFLDLQMAEANARESQIEAGLERVRSRTLAMHKSDELAETAAVVFNQLIGLGIAPNRLYIGLVKDKNGEIEYWITDEDGGKVSKQFTGNANRNASMNTIFTAWQEKRRSITIDMQGEELKKYFHYLANELQVPFKGGLEQKRRVQHIAFFGQGFIGIASTEPQPEETLQLLERFAAVFNLTYTRFNDLQLAEARAKEAVLEASLERMRSVAMSIRRSEELIQVAESLYNELKGLGITNIRNAQIVIKVAGDEMYLVCVYSDETSEVFRESRYDTSPITQQMYNELESSNEALYQKELTGKEFEQWLKWREDTGAKINSRLLEARSVTFCLYSIGEGHLGISTYNNITAEQLTVLKRFRNVFELSYRRFMDVAKSEEQALKLQQEKDRLEFALNELQTTQKQLIQSEKMASLGELTAGIAHEIQNPLNFVNNFSEVSNELLQEMLDEVEKGNFEEVKIIADNVKQNLDKINHHGKRADGIVKGMLQHSRSSSGQKEPTDINALTDEYLRLAYHGLRAKDKTFNATMKTDYDNLLGKVNVIPQDMGRVILNLITNAFYVVAEKKKSGIPGYEPTVSVSTKKTNDIVEIKVADNGNGIPQKVLDKIFQPFFTTKPTGQGTGLGLSLSYDIIRAHGGEIKVETKENEGTLFTIILPNA